MLNVYDLVIKTDGNLKVNRKVDIDLELDASEGEEDYLNKENTVIEINKIDSDGNVITGLKDIFLFDDSKTEWNHRKLIFKEAGSYKISASVTDGYDTVNAEKIITVAKDNAPVALINLSADEGENTDNEDVKSEVIGLIDEAWVNKRQGILQSNGNVLYDINIWKIIGTNGEDTIRIITKGYSNNIIFSFGKGGELNDMSIL